MYTRMSPIEHVLHRPGMYIGSVTAQACEDWVLGRTEAGEGVMVHRDLVVSPGLLKVFDEVLVNALDNAKRGHGTSRIDVRITPGRQSEAVGARLGQGPLRAEEVCDLVADGLLPCITVANDGRGVPVVVHRDEEMLTPDLVFGELQSGSNFDDGEERYTGGRHGLGAKLANIFSLLFEVETCDARRGKSYLNAWSNNMRDVGTADLWTPTSAPPGGRPVLRSHLPTLLAQDEDFTRVSFVPDVTKLCSDAREAGGAAAGAAHVIDDDTLQLLERRVWDAAATTPGVTVTLNGTAVPALDFEEYAKLFAETAEGGASPHYMRCNTSFEVAFAERASTSKGGDISFVNGMCTPFGGHHVEAVARQLMEHIQPQLKGLRIPQSAIRARVRIFVNALIANAEFDSQRKERLITPPHAWKQQPRLSKKFMDEFLEKTDIVEDLVADASARKRRQAERVFDTAKNVDVSLEVKKLEDAHKAGTPNSESCTLILTEGDSAKAFAVAGLEVVGREHFGVFPLRGKLRNVRGMGISQLTGIADVENLCKVLGLHPSKRYDPVADAADQGMRYGRVMVMADQDEDGTHIKGLVFNLFASIWPSLLEKDGFLQAFRTPLLKVTVPSTRGKKGGGAPRVFSFYSRQEFDAWRHGDDGNAILSRPGVRVKYYKGLGTNSNAEAREYFGDLAHHRQIYELTGEDDANALDLAFNKDKSQERRVWLDSRPWSQADTHTSVDGDKIGYDAFINNELSLFSMADNVRSIPSVIDGLKPSQRKVLYASFKRRLTQDMKVAQLGGYVAEKSAYHHGEVSLHSTIVAMAQDYIGANNLPLLVPVGQFGTRHEAGKDAASPRYIFTKLSPVARLLFPEIDDKILAHAEDDGELVEPVFYAPVIPLVLVNGAKGIGTGWATDIPMHNPLHIVDAIRRRLSGKKDGRPLRPWVKGFRGEIVVEDGGAKFRSRGLIERGPRRVVSITEMPLGTVSEAVKGHMRRLLEAKRILGFKVHNTATHWHYDVQLSLAESRKRKTDESLVQLFKLERPHTAMLHAFDADGHLKKYESAEEILDDFMEARMALYERRYRALASQLESKALRLRNRERFVDGLVGGDIEIYRKTREEVHELLVAAGFTPEPMIVELSQRELDEKYRGDAGVAEDGEGDFDYLLKTNFLSVTKERLDGLRAELRDTEAAIAELDGKAPVDLWLEDLAKLRKHLVQDGGFTDG